MSILDNLEKSAKPIFEKKFSLFVFLMIALKIVVSGFFSSGFNDELFYPFFANFLENGNSPWDDFTASGGRADAFPYHPLMFYIFLPFYYIGSLFKVQYLTNALFKIPLVAADAFLFYSICKVLGSKRVSILIIYFFSPIVFYASFLHGQLDLVPTAFLFISVYMLSKRNSFWAAVFFGFALSCKLHVVAALPLFLIYIWRNHSLSKLLFFGFIVSCIYLLFTGLYFFDQGFRSMVLFNEKQAIFYDTSFPVGKNHILFPVLAVLVVYFRFVTYKKINNDLFVTYLAILFSIFVMLVQPSPAWYLWALPFICVFYLKVVDTNRSLILLYGFFSILYTVHFLFFHQSTVADLKFLGNSISFAKSAKASDFSFTLLFTTLFLTLYVFYKFGVRSNRVYKVNERLIIGIGGDSGTGKSTLMNDLKALFPYSLLEIEGDADHKWERGDANWKEITHLNPKANWLYRQADSIYNLKHGKKILRSDYDHNTGKFTDPRLIRSKDFIALSGLHPFYLPKMRKLIDFKIFMAPEEKLRQEWKIERDMKKRGYSRQKILNQIKSRLKDARKYIHPQSDHSDMVVSLQKGKKNLELTITLDSKFHIEDALDNLNSVGVEVEWDFLSDLRRQQIRFNSEPDINLFRQALKYTIPNHDELIQAESKWADGYRGVVQFFSLVCLSQMLQGEID